MTPTISLHQYQRRKIPRTIISVSLVIISMRLYPCDAAFAACNMTLVSNSSDCMEREDTLFEPHGYQHKDFGGYSYQKL